MLIIRLIIYFFIIVSAVSFYCFLISVRPPRFQSDITPEELGIKDYEEIKLKTSDGISLSAWYIPASIKTDKAIIVCHGYPADKGDVLGLATFLHHDYNLLLFDFRGLGKSGGKFVTAGAKEINDFNSAVDYLLKRGMKSIGAYGFSMGAAVILLANNPAVKAIVSNSSYARLEMLINEIYSRFGYFKAPFVMMTKLWAKILLGINTSRINPVDTIKGNSIPLFLIHSEKDSQIPIKHFMLLRQARPSAEYWIIPEADHGELGSFWLEYQRKIKNFFNRYLK